MTIITYKTTNVRGRPAGTHRVFLPAGESREVINSVGNWLLIREGWIDLEEVRILNKGPEGTPQAPYQADGASAQPTAISAEDLLRLIRCHNLTVETFERVAKQVKVDGWLFGGKEMWYRIACEGDEIVELARRLGIDATISMQKGEIILK